MKAVIINSYGSPEVLQYQDAQQPQIKRDQLLIKVHASSVNPIDWKIRKGMLRLLTGNSFPMILGFDVSGEVVAVGESVTQFQPGDLIYARLDQLIGGAYAEYAAVAAKVAAPKPKNLTHEEAAAVPLAALTALQALRDEAGLQPGYKVLINGSSGGVGTFAVQIAKAMAAEVTAVCSRKNIELVKSLGADRTIDYTQQDFTQNTALYDIVFDVVGNRSFAQCKDVLTQKGVYVTTQPLPASYLESLLTLPWPGKKAKVILLKPSAQDLADLKELIEADKVRCVIDRTYPLAETATAHAYSETEHAVGKIVITVT